MTSLTPISPAPAGVAPATVALLGPAAPPAEALRHALAALPRSADVAWRIAPADAVPAVAVDIVLCDAGLTATAADRWPAAAVVALVPAWDEATAVVRALEDGANVCVRGGDNRVIAAYVQSVARRRGLATCGGAHR
jgi:hypothetical protein